MAELNVNRFSFVVFEAHNRRMLKKKEKKKSVRFRGKADKN